MAEISYFWEGDSVGDAQYLTSEEFTDVFGSIVHIQPSTILLTAESYFTERYTVGYGYAKWLEVEVNKIAETVTVYPGGAIIDGKVYVLREPITFTCNRGGRYRLVLRKDFPSLGTDGIPRGQTVQLVMLHVDVSYFDQPWATREEGVRWDMTLGLFYNDRDPSTGATTSKEPLDWHQDTYFWNAYNTPGDGSEWGRRNFPYNTINIPSRHGGHATNWGVSGTTKYIVQMARIEVGTVSVSGANPLSHTFAMPFGGSPIVILQPVAGGTQWGGNNYCISAISSVGFSARFDTADYLDDISYFAIGPI